jgi:competence protein ComEC
MRVAILGFVAGAACLQTRAALPAHPLLALCITLLGCIVLMLLLRARPRAWRSVVALPCGAALGFFWAATLAQAALAPQLAPAGEGRDLEVIGTVASLPYRFNDGVRFNFAVEKVLGGDIAVPKLVALSWYASANRGANRSTSPASIQGGKHADVGDVQPGERWALTVRLQRPHGNANEHGFDYEVWLLEQGLRATGYVRAGPAQNRRLEDFVFSAGNLVEHCRAVLRARILHSLAGQQYAGVIVALVIGDQRSIEQSDWTVFNRTGVGHLISISGLHITMISGLFALLTSSLWRRSFFTGLQLPLMIPAQKVAALAGAATALLYVLLAGFGVPAQRTLYMLSVVAMALWLGRISSVSQILCTALGLVVLLDPWAVLWPGFWLSFCAVALILYASVGRSAAHPAAMNQSSQIDAAPMDFAAPAFASPPRLRLLLRSQRAWGGLMAIAHTQYVVTLGLAPLTMLLFAQVSLVSPLANALAIPLISLVVTPLALAGSLLPAPLSWPLLWLAHGVIALLAQFLQWLSAFPFALWSAPLPPWWIFCWAMFGTVWMLAPRGWPQRKLGLVAWLPLLTALPESPPAGRMQITAFDVGQGMALLVETSGHRLLYDTGPAYALDSNGGSRVIAPYLKARGIGVLDAVIVTHSDSDHSGGALTVLRSVDVGWVASSLPPNHLIVLAAPQHRRCQAGQSWVWDGVHFEMLHPTPASYSDPALSPNARSCVLKIDAGGKAILLTGDIEAAQEAQLIARTQLQADGLNAGGLKVDGLKADALRADTLKSDVLLAPHHGSGTSSTRAFLLAVQPELALFQVGYRNRYRHPKPEVFERYRELGIERLRTDVSGALTLQLGPALTVTEYRKEHPRYWYGR